MEDVEIEDLSSPEIAKERAKGTPFDMVMR